MNKEIKQLISSNKHLKMENMIYLNLKGGLGNMLFQIAAATSMGLDKNLPVSFPNIDAHLKFCNDENVHNTKLKHAYEYKNLGMFQNMLSTIPPYNLPIFEYPFEYTPKQPQQPQFIINGFFQSEKYFKNNANKILALFEPTIGIKTLINEKYPWIHEEGLTSIHVRRGDYVKLSKWHNGLTTNYYEKAIKYTGYVTNKYIVFSDDIDWCKSQFLGDSFIFVENEKDYIELYLMARCKNNITCNSSFSWWGAWLNLNPHKVIIASTEDWFGPELSHLNSSDIIPESWEKI